jgi:molecular chaperone GrpE
MTDDGNDETKGDAPGDGSDVEVWVVDEEAETGEAGAQRQAEKTDPRAEVERLEKELAQVRDQWLRTLADLDNYRKRSEREQRELRRYALFEPLRDLLPVVDNLERALSAGGEVEDLKRGVRLILQQLQDYLRSQGVREIAALGAPFDPSQHDAVSRFEDPGVTAPTVADELQRGYALAERLLRPALVRVAMPLPRPAEPVAGDGDGENGGNGLAGRGGGDPDAGGRGPTT